MKERIIERLGDLEDVDVWVYEPTDKYQYVAKRTGVEELTPARALIAEMVRRYWVLGIECTYLEVQKLGWFLERAFADLRIAPDPLDLQFKADKYGPYSDRLRHLLDGLDGTYLHCDKRLSDAGPFDTIWFDQERRKYVELYLQQVESAPLRAVLDYAAQRIDGFQSPLGMELLATVDWLLEKEQVTPDTASVRCAIAAWPGGDAAGERKLRLFDERLVSLALEQLQTPIPSFQA